MIGELSALGCAVLWAVSSIMIRSHTNAMDAVFINAFRCLVSVVVFVALAAGLGLLGDIRAWDRSTTLYLSLATLSGFVIGDTCYYRSLALIGVSRTLPISGSYPVLTLVVSAVAFGKAVGLLEFLGAFVVVGGVYLVGSSRDPTSVEQRRSPASRSTSKGVLLAVLAAVSWSLSINVLKVAIEDVHVLPANAFRMTLATVLLVSLVLARHKGFPRLGKYPRRSLVVVGASSIVGLVAGSLLFVLAVKHTTAGRAAVLTATAPLFAVPLARVFLKERVTLQLAVGVVLSVVGIWLIMMSEGRAVT